MRRLPARGFTYLGLIILLAILGLVAAAGLKYGTLLQRAAAEEELLEIGAQFSEALRSYAAATPQGQPQQPPSLKELLKDPRFPNPRRHLRKIFVDPVTGKEEWGIIYLGDKVGVLGVYSLSTARPLKIANFDIRFQNMENRERISDWKFLMAGGDGVPPAVLTPPNSPLAPGASLFNNAPPGSPPGTAPGMAPGQEPPKGGGATAPMPVPPEPVPAAEPEPEPEAPPAEVPRPEPETGVETGTENQTEAEATDSTGATTRPETTAPPPAQRR
jgi:type II secretory pathway pseudopilin PulG